MKLFSLLICGALVLHSGTSFARSSNDCTQFAGNYDQQDEFFDRIVVEQSGCEALRIEYTPQEGPSYTRELPFDGEKRIEAHGENYKLLRSYTFDGKVIQKLGDSYFTYQNGETLHSFEVGTIKKVGSLLVETGEYWSEDGDFLGAVQWTYAPTEKTAK